MFDIIDFALENNVAIVIDPYSEVGLKITVGTGVLTSENATTVDCCFHMETEPYKAEEACEKIMSMFEKRDNSLFKDICDSRKRAEMEKFWNESTPIIMG